MKTFEESVERSTFGKVLDQAREKRIALMKCGQLHCPCCYPEMSSRLRDRGDYLALQLEQRLDRAAAEYQMAMAKNNLEIRPPQAWQGIDIYDVPAGAD